MACIGILAALRRRDRYGIGAALDISMFDSMFNLGLLGLASGMARAAGATGEPAMEIWGGNPRYALYPTRDGKTVAGLSPGIALLAEVLRSDRTPLTWPPNGKILLHRLSNHGALTETYRKTIAEYCMAHDRDQIAHTMAKHAIPVVPVLTPDEALASDHVAHRNLLSRIADPIEGSSSR